MASSRGSADEEDRVHGALSLTATLILVMP